MRFSMEIFSVKVYIQSMTNAVSTIGSETRKKMFLSRSLSLLGATLRRYLVQTDWCRILYIFFQKPVIYISSAFQFGKVLM